MTNSSNSSNAAGLPTCLEITEVLQILQSWPGLTPCRCKPLCKITHHGWRPNTHSSIVVAFYADETSERRRAARTIRAVVLKILCNVVFWHSGARGPIEWPCCILTARSFVFLCFDDFFFGKCTRKNCQSFGVNKQGNKKLERGFCLQSNFALQSTFLRWPWVIELYNDYVTHTNRFSFSFSFQRYQIYTDPSHTICVC